MRLYFAYGANMVRRDMARRCPGARCLGPAVLHGHRFAIIRGGHGTVLPERGACVHGLLWRIGRAGERALDRYEEVARGLYHRTQRVVLWRGRQVGALVYVAAARTKGHARGAYLDGILAAAQAEGLPADYVAALETMARTSSGVRPASRSALSVTERSRLA